MKLFLIPIVRETRTPTHASSPAERQDLVVRTHIPPERRPPETSRDAPPCVSQQVGRPVGQVRSTDRIIYLLQVKVHKSARLFMSSSLRGVRHSMGAFRCPAKMVEAEGRGRRRPRGRCRNGRRRRQLRSAASAMSTAPARPPRCAYMHPPICAPTHMRTHPSVCLSVYPQAQAQ